MEIDAPLLIVKDDGKYLVVYDHETLSYRLVNLKQGIMEDNQQYASAEILIANENPNTVYEKFNIYKGLTVNEKNKISTHEIDEITRIFKRK